MSVSPEYQFEQRLGRLAQIDHKHLRCPVGLEKESLRVTAATGVIAQTPHPRGFGSALTNPYITTDYSEALLEFITPPCAELSETLAFLDDVHRFVYSQLRDEFLWGASMPCVVGGEQGVPIAEYGSSNIGRMKRLYRIGLSYRYGRIMQVIAGVHFNFSLPESFWPLYQEIEGDRQELRPFQDASYFGLIRNLQRFGWLILYLFGASPAICKSFMAGKPTTLAEFDRNTYYGPYATSLRMSDIGYTNKIDRLCDVRVSYDSLQTYVDTLNSALHTPCPGFERIGVKVDGEYRQLNANILQIENEYYSTMRPKQPPQRGERPTQALTRRGVRYVELRSVDISPFDPLGVNLVQVRFLKAFLLYCLLRPSPLIDLFEREEINSNQRLVADRGRDPVLQLQNNASAVSLQSWAQDICQEMQGVCELLDASDRERPYSAALAVQQAMVADVERTPSARVLREMRSHGEGFFHFAKRCSLKHQDTFLSHPPRPHQQQLLTDAAQQSLAEQAAIETADTLSFDEFLARAAAGI